jgi:hypothetical protein
MEHDRTSVLKRCAGFVVLAFLSTASLAACGEQPGQPQPPAAPPATQLSPQPGISTITPNFTELPVDQTTEPAETVPWHLIRVDLKENRVYLSSSSVDCTTPEKVRLTESAAEIKISVTGRRAGEPCTAQLVTLVGYVQIRSIGERQVAGNSG